VRWIITWTLQDPTGQVVDTLTFSTVVISCFEDASNATCQRAAEVVGPSDEGGFDTYTPPPAFPIPTMKVACADQGSQIATSGGKLREEA
jgi:hypothetical protein